jgi:hypothetical protein
MSSLFFYLVFRVAHNANTSFGQMPADPTAPNQVARKQYVDDTTTAWSVGG